MTPAASREPSSGEGLVGLGIGHGKKGSSEDIEGVDGFVWTGNGVRMAEPEQLPPSDAIGASSSSSQVVSSVVPEATSPSGPQRDPTSSSDSSQVEPEGVRRLLRQASGVTDMTSGDRSSVFEIPSRPTTAEPGDGPGSRRSRIISVPRKKGEKEGKVSGQKRKDSLGMTIQDFECMRVLGKGCAGKVCPILFEADE